MVNSADIQPRASVFHRGDVYKTPSVPCIYTHTRASPFTINCKITILNQQMSVQKQHSLFNLKHLSNLFFMCTNMGRGEALVRCSHKFVPVFIYFFTLFFFLNKEISRMNVRLLDSNMPHCYTIIHKQIKM